MERWEHRAKKLHRRRHGMRVTGRSTLLLADIIARKAQEANMERCPRCKAPASIRKPGRCVNADCPKWEGPHD